MSLYVKFLQISSSIINNRDYKLDQHAIKLIKYDLPQYFELSKSGYIPNNSVQNILNEEINKFIGKNDLKSVENVINHTGTQLSPEQAFLILNHVSKKEMVSHEYNLDHESTFYSHPLDKRIEIYFNDNLKSYEPIKKQLITISNTEQFQKMLLDSFIRTSEELYYSIDYTNENFLKMSSCYKLLSIEQFKKTKIENYLITSNHLKKNLEFFKGILKDTWWDSEKKAWFSHYSTTKDNIKVVMMSALFDKFSNDLNIIYSDNINQMKNKSKIQFLGQNANKIALEQLSLDLKEKLTSDYLPKSSLKIIKDIQDKYENILKSNSDSNIATDSEKIINKQLPVVINKYLSIADEYKKTMTNSQGKNAEDLLIESLISINSLLENNLNALQNDNLKDLSAQNRFLKSKLLS